MAISEDNRWAFVTSRGADVVTVINNATRAIRSVVEVGEGPTGIAAASQPVSPIQFHPGAPIVIELPRIGAGPTPEEFPRGTWLFTGGLVVLPLTAGFAYRRRIRGPR